MEKDTLHWLFSTIAQTYGAIIGVIGMLAVFRLQILYNSIKDNMDRSAAQRRYLFGLPSADQSPQSFIEAWRRYKETQNISGENFLENISVDLINSLDSINKIKFLSVNFVLYHLFIIIFSIVALLFCGTLSEHIFLNTISIIFLFCTIAFSIVLIGNLIFVLLAMDKKEYKTEVRNILKLVSKKITNCRK